MIDYLPWAIVHLGALALILLCAAGLGNLVLRKHRFQNLVERLVFITTLGLGLCGLVLFLLGLLGILYQSVIWFLTVAGAVATVFKVVSANWALFGIPQVKRVLGSVRWKNLYNRRNAVTGLVIILAVCYWALLLMKSQYPPHDWDATSNHLVIARENLKAHRLVLVLGIPLPVVPLLNHMLFTWAMAIKDDVLAQMIVHTFLMLPALGLYAWGKRQNRTALGCAAATLWLAHPLIRLLEAAAYVDVGLTCFVFLGLYALHVFWDSGKTRWWYLGLSLLAMAAATKVTGLFFLGLGSLLGLWPLVLPFFRRLWPNSRQKDFEKIASADRFTWRPLVVGWTCALMIVLPWYAFNTYHTGNPLWPAFYQYSRGIWALPSADLSWEIRGLREATLQKFLMLYVDFIRYPGRFDAPNNLTLFPIIVAWPLAWIVAVFNRSVRWWVFWALAFTVFWYLQAPMVRFWIPVLPIAGLALCESIQVILEKIRNLRSLHSAIWITATVVVLAWSTYDFSKEVYAWGLPPATADARQTWLNRLNGYPGVEYVNEHAKNSDTVCVLSASWLNYYFNQRVIDLRGALYGYRKPTFRWPNDQLWTEWMAYENVEWLFIYYRAPELVLPGQDPKTDPFWPDYQLVYASDDTWVFRRKHASKA